MMMRSAQPVKKSQPVMPGQKEAQACHQFNRPAAQNSAAPMLASTMSSRIA